MQYLIILILVGVLHNALSTEPSRRRSASGARRRDSNARLKPPGFATNDRPKSPLRRRREDSSDSEDEPRSKSVRRNSRDTPAAAAADASAQTAAVELDEIANLFSMMNVNEAPPAPPPTSVLNGTPQPAPAPANPAKKKPDVGSAAKKIAERGRKLPELTTANVPPTYRPLRDKNIDAPTLDALLYVLEVMKLNTDADVGVLLARLAEHTRFSLFGELTAEYRTAAAASADGDIVFWTKFHRRLTREIFTRNYPFIDMNLRASLEYAVITLGYKIALATSDQAVGKRSRRVTQYFTPLEDAVELFQIIIAVEGELEARRRATAGSMTSSSGGYTAAFNGVARRYRDIGVQRVASLDDILDVILRRQDGIELFLNVWPYALPIFLPPELSALKVFFSGATNNLVYASQYRLQILSKCEMKMREKTKTAKMCLYGTMSGLFSKIQDRMLKEYAQNTSDIGVDRFTALHHVMMTVGEFIGKRFSEGDRARGALSVDDANYAKVVSFLTSPFLIGGAALGLGELVTERAQGPPSNSRRRSTHGGGGAGGTSRRMSRSRPTASMRGPRFGTVN